MNILIVDDHAISRKLLRAQLESEGVDVLEAVDGIQALALLERESQLDGIVSDIIMPNMDGYRFCRKVRENTRFSAIPLILYSSTFDAHSDGGLSKAVGADRFIVKPAKVEVILNALREARQTAHTRKPLPHEAIDEDCDVKGFSQSLVNKLEERNIELQESLESLRLAHEEILELNRNLEHRVAECTTLLGAAD